MESAPGLQLQPRDFVLLKGFFESRIMTLQHVADLYFGGRKEAAKKRLQKFKKAGFIAERARCVNEPSILSLTRTALEFLVKNKCLDDYPKLGWAALQKRGQVSDLTLKHELGVMDVKATLAVALRSTPVFNLREFTTWPRLSEFSARRPSQNSAGIDVAVKPDGFIRIEERELDGRLSEHTFFLELDRSTETQETLVLRAACYADYYRSGGLAARYGQPRTAYKDFPFRLLVVCKTLERLNNAAERMLRINPPIFTFAWLTTMQAVLDNPLGAIWIRPIDYRDALRGTAFDTEQTKSPSFYRRQSERETLVERSVKRLALLAP